MRRRPCTRAWRKDIASDASVFPPPVGTRDKGITIHDWLAAQAMQGLKGSHPWLAHIDQAASRGAHVACGGNRIGQTGFFLQPTVLTDVTVRDTMGNEDSGRFGEGIFAGSGGSLRVARGLLESNNEAGLVAEPAQAGQCFRLSAKPDAEPGHGLADGRAGWFPEP